MYRRQRTNQKKRSQIPCSTKSSSSAASEQNAEARTAQNNRDYTIFNIATQESWKNDKGEYETRTEWHRVFAWGKLTKFAGTLQKGQLITLEGILRYREVETKEHGTQRIAEIHATSLKRLSKVEVAFDPEEEAEQD
jgi:single-strand DNA-binding protein